MKFLYTKCRGRGQGAQSDLEAGPGEATSPSTEAPTAKDPTLQGEGDVVKAEEYEPAGILAVSVW